MNPPYEYRAVVTRVVDGDTIDADVDLGFHTHAHLRFRLLGIDAPETYGVKKGSPEYEAGMRAKTWLQDEIEGQIILLRSEKAGKYGRWLATIWTTDGKEVNSTMVAMGLAEPY